MSRKYAKDLWAINFNYFMRTQAEPPLTHTEEEQFKMVREHLVRKYNNDMARFAVSEEAMTRFKEGSAKNPFVPQ